MLNDQNLREVARGLAATRMAERRRLFARDTERIVGEAVGAGRLKTGYFAQDLVEHYVVEAQRRARDLWSIVHRVVVTTGVRKDSDLSIALRGFMVEMFSAEMTILKEDLATRLQAFGGHEQTVKRFEDASGPVMEEIRWEIELFFRSLEPSGDVVVQNVYQAPVGTIVTGGSVTIGSQYVMGDVGELRAAVVKLREGLEALDPGLVPEEEALRELLSDAEDELSRPQPRKLKVGTLLSGIATTVQTIPAVVPAYRTLKAAAAQLGVVLP